MRKKSNDNPGKGWSLFVIELTIRICLYDLSTSPLC